MKNHFKKILFLALGIILIPSFVGAVVLKSVSESIGTSDISCTSPEGSITKNTSVNFGVDAVGYDLSATTFSWSGTGVIGKTLQSFDTAYSTAGIFSDISVTLEDPSLNGPLTIKCNPVTVLKTLSDAVGTNDISCTSPEGSITKNTSVNFGVDAVGYDLSATTFSWSGTGVIGKTLQSFDTAYSTAGTFSDISVTLEDPSLNGPLTIKCNPVTVLKTLSDAVGTNDISCISPTSPVSKGASVNFGIKAEGYNLSSITASWSGTGVSGKTLQSFDTAYSTAGTFSDISVTLEDPSLNGPMTIKCNPITVTTITTGGGGSTGGGSTNTCNLVGNIDGDRACDVDIFDFNLLMLNWGSTVSGNKADLNKDGIVDILDFNILMLNWTGTL
ncbi:MAG: hypothetical protein WC827_02565 [Candidatus Paceibacterota bacterium]|jgi:hypothetical protein